MRVRTISLMIFGCLMALSSFATDFEFEHEGQTLIYTVTDKEAKTVRVYCPIPDSKLTGELVIPSIVKYEDIEYSVTAIYSQAFWGCTGLTSLTIPETVTTIGSAVFYGCSSLTSVTIPALVNMIDERTFYGCSGLTSVTIPESVVSIGNSAFYGCSSLTSIIIPESVTSIGGNAFYDCSGLESVYFNAVNCNQCGYNFSPSFPSNIKNLYIGDKVEIIPAYAFYKCDEINSVTIGDSVKTIGFEAFYGCSGLTSLILGSSITTIRGEAFYNCGVLPSVTIPETVTSIGTDAFGGTSCKTLYFNAMNCAECGNMRSSNLCGAKTLIIGENVEYIPPYAFYNFSELTSVTIPGSVTSIGEGAFDRCTGLSKAEFANIDSLCAIKFDSPTSNPLYHANNLYVDGQEIKDLFIPVSVTSIGPYAFSGSTGLTSVAIPSSVTSIGEYAFWGCTGLTSVSIGSSVTSIGSYAFSYCSSLPTVIIPNSVTSIGTDAFVGCNGLKKSAYPNSLSNPFKSGTVITYKPEDVLFEDGLIWDSNKTSIYFAPLDIEGDYIIPTTVTSIGANAFFDCRVLSSVTIPNSVTSIGNRAFTGCSGLTSVIIPSSVTSIGTNAFADCIALKKGLYPIMLSDPFEPGVGVAYTPGEVIIDEGIVYDESKTTILFVSKYIEGEFVIPNFVTSIGPNAFEGCSGLTSVVIPQSVITIEEGAFRDCNSLTSVIIPATVTIIGSKAFYGCTGLTAVTIPGSVTTIGEGAFSGCNGLTTVTVPESLKSIGSGAFSRCSGLETLYFNAVNCTECGDSWGVFPSNVKNLIIGENVTNIPDYAFRRCSGLTSLTIPEPVTSIGKNAFEYCTGLTSVSIGNSVTIIDNGAFSQCYHLTSVIIGDSVISIGSQAFMNCSELASVTIPNSVISIGSSAFNECRALTSLTIGASVASIGEHAFYERGSLETLHYNAVNCIECESYSFTSSIRNLYIGENVINIPKYAFSGCTVIETVYFDAENCTECHLGSSQSNIKNLYIGEKVKKIPDNAFSGFSGVTSVIIPESVTSIGEYSFSGCSGLTTLTIPESVITIGKYAFCRCNGLTSVTIGNSVVSIGERAFNGCSDLTSVIIPESVTSISEYAFYDCTGLQTVYFNAVNCTRCGSWTKQVFPSNIQNLYIGEKVSIIPDYAFYGCSGLASLAIPRSVTSIGVSSFAFCNGLETLYFNAENCIECHKGSFPSNIKKLYLGDNIKSIPSEAFSSIKGFTSVTIPESVTTIGGDAFSDCSGLETLYFDAEVCSECGSSSNPVFPSNIKNLYLGEKVINIPDYAFYGCNGLTSLTIPESVASIGNSAFYGCSSLTSVLTNSLKAWIKINFGNETANPTYYAKKLLVDDETIRKLTIPEGINRINSYAFINCEPLVTVTISNSVCSAGAFAFSGCTGLQRIIFPDEITLLSMHYDNVFSLLKWNNNAKYYINSDLYEPEEVILPELLTYIPDFAFYDWKYLKRIVLHDKIESIGRCSFTNCNGLSAVNFPNSVKSIGEGAFSNCSGLISVNFPDKVKSIGASAFSNCRGLISVTAGRNLASIGESAFKGCNHLDSVKVVSVNSWARIQFSDRYSNPLYYAHSLYVGDGVEPVKNIVIEGEQPISSYAFYNASDLNKVRVKDIAALGEQVFYNCTNLTDICLNTSELGPYSFSECSSINNIYIPVCEPPFAPDDAFSNYVGISLYVPQGCVSKYESAETCWWRFLDVLESDFEDIDTLFAPDYQDISTRVEGVVFDSNENQAISCLNDIYTLQGICLKRNATDDDVKVLSPGLYIIAGKKVLVK